MLDLNLYLIAGQIITFLAGMAILWQIAYKPISGIFRQRADKISADLAAAEKTRGDSELLKADYESRLAQLAEQAQQMLSQTVKEAQAVREEILNNARDQSQEMLKRTVEQIKQEKQKAVKELRQQVLEVSLLVAEKAIGETINADLQRRLVDQVFAQIEVENNAGR